MLLVAHTRDRSAAFVGRIRFSAIILLLTVCIATPAHAQQQQGDVHAADLARIRELATTGRHSFSGGHYADSAIFWSGAYARPLIGRKDTAIAVALPGNRPGERRIASNIVTVRRIEIAQAGDMAYEFSDYTISEVMTSNNQQRTFSGSLLRVWRKIDGDWKIVAGFMHPFANVETK